MSLKGLARVHASDSVILNPEPFTLGSSASVWLPLLLYAALLIRVPQVNAFMLTASGLTFGARAGDTSIRLKETAPR
jgi:hypothetical protein